MSLEMMLRGSSNYCCKETCMGSFLSHSLVMVGYLNLYCNKLSSVD